MLRRGSPEVDELEVLSILIEQDESVHFPIELPDPSRLLAGMAGSDFQYDRAAIELLHSA